MMLATLWVAVGCRTYPAEPSVLKSLRSTARSQSAEKLRTFIPTYQECTPKNP